MNEFTALFAFALPPPELARDLIRHLNTPALATLLGKASLKNLPASPAYARALPHEVWLTQYLFSNSKLPAHAVMQAIGLAVPSKHCFMLNPVHIHIARDHLILTDARQLEFGEIEARQLFEAAAPYFAEQGLELIYGTPQLWFVAAEKMAELDCASLDAACGHNIDIWLPRQAAQQNEREWRKLQNEIQMLWYAHPVNEDRIDKGLAPVNALWLSGATPAAPANTSSATLWRMQEETPPLAAHTLLGKPVNLSSAETWQTPPKSTILYVDQLSSAGLAGDWGTWLAQMQALEQNCFAPLLQQLQTGRIQELKLLLADSNQILECRLNKWSLRWPWRKASLTALQQARK